MLLSHQRNKVHVVINDIPKHHKLIYFNQQLESYRDSLSRWESSVCQSNKSYK